MYLESPTYNWNLDAGLLKLQHMLFKCWQSTALIRCPNQVNLWFISEDGALEGVYRSVCVCLIWYYNASCAGSMEFGGMIQLYASHCFWKLTDELILNEKDHFTWHDASKSTHTWHLLWKNTHTPQTSACILSSVGLMHWNTRTLALGSDGDTHCCVSRAKMHRETHFSV